MNDLSQYGWNESLSRQKQASEYKDFKHGRISVTHKTCYEVISQEGLYTCELTGNMIYGRDSCEYPCTGDWVIFQPTDTHKGIIYDILPRNKTLYRQKSGTVSDRQAIASHVDKAFIVQSLEKSLNTRRIERFLLQISTENIKPILVLTKTDLGFDRNQVDNALKHLSKKLPVIFTSSQSRDSVDQLRAYIESGETIVFIGMSGAGKSTLINILCKQEIQPTATISNATGKGKHTTTRREMILMHPSGVLIDTPGIKVFGVTNDDSKMLSEVLNMEDFEKMCRFKDCQHINEKGCAVIEAVKKGEIKEEVYQNYLKLRKEARHYTSSRHEKKRNEKSLSKTIKEFKHRDKHK